MEPLLVGKSAPHRPGLTDLALELAQRSAGFKRSLPESLLICSARIHLGTRENTNRQHGIRRHPPCLVRPHRGNARHLLRLPGSHCRNSQA